MIANEWACQFCEAINLALRIPEEDIPLENNGKEESSV
jgi:hypothetical protein